MDDGEIEKAIKDNAEIESAFLLQLDKVFPFLYDAGSMYLTSIIPSYLAVTNVSSVKYTTDSAMAMMLTKYGYAKVTAPMTYNVELTDKGREAKAAGGHFAYIEKTKAKEIKEADRQRIIDNVTGFDLLTKKFIYRYRFLPYIVSILAFIVSALAYFRPIKEQPQTPPTQDKTLPATKTTPVHHFDTAKKIMPK